MAASSARLGRSDREAPTAGARGVDTAASTLGGSRGAVQRDDDRSLPSIVLALRGPEE